MVPRAPFDRRHPGHLLVPFRGCPHERDITIFGRDEEVPRGQQFLDERGSEDTLGRALWGLGTAVALAATPPVQAIRYVAAGK